MRDLRPLATDCAARAIVELLQSPTLSRLILLRHGRTEWNAAGRLQGRKDSPLDDRGRAQAKALGRLLENVPLAAVRCSDLGRSTRTAHLLADANATPPEVLKTPLLAEMGLGLLEGELKDAQSSEEASACYVDLCNDEVNYRVPRGGESLRDVYARVKLFFEQFEVALAQNGNHVIVAHRNVNKMIIKHWLGLTFEQGFAVEQENSRMYVFVPSTGQLLSCLVEDGNPAADFPDATADGVYA